MNVLASEEMSIQNGLVKEVLRRTDASQFAAHEITVDIARRCRIQQNLLILWPAQAMSLGMGQSSSLHRHHATQIIISLGTPLRVRTYTSGPYIEQKSIIINPYSPHQVKATAVPSFVFWSEPRALAALIQRLSALPTSPLPPFPENLLSVLLLVLLASGEQVPDEQARQAMLSYVLPMLIGQTWDEGPDDLCITSARSLMIHQPLIEQFQPILSLDTRVYFVISFAVRWACRFSALCAGSACWLLCVPVHTGRSSPKLLTRWDPLTLHT